MFGPVIETDFDPATASCAPLVAGRERQNYALSDMFFSPAELVSRLSQDMTLEPGDVILCGTSLGVLPMKPGTDGRGGDRRHRHAEQLLRRVASSASVVRSKFLRFEEPGSIAVPSLELTVPAMCSLSCLCRETAVRRLSREHCAGPLCSVHVPRPGRSPTPGDMNGAGHPAASAAARGLSLPLQSPGRPVLQTAAIQPHERQHRVVKDRST